MKETSLKKNLFFSTLYQVLTIILPLITAPYVSRVLGVDGIGVYSYTHSYSMYFSLFGALGTVSYGTREIARHRNNKSEYSKIFWEIFSLAFITSLISVFAWGIWAVLNTQYRIYYLILTLSVAATIFDISWLFAGLEYFKYSVMQNSVCKLIGVILIFLLVKKENDLWVYTLIMSLTVFLANISMWIYLPKFVCKTPIKSLEIKKHLKETLVYFIPTVATSVYTILDKTLIGLITKDMTENGNYEQATKIINMAKTLSFAGVNMVLQSRISYLFAEKKNEEIKSRIKFSLDYILFMGIGIGFGIIAVSNTLVPLFYGDGYDKTIILLMYMSPLITIIGVSNCLGFQYYNPAGLRALSAKFIIIGSIINLILNIALIPSFRSIGAIVATIVAELIISFLYMQFCNNYYSYRTLIGQGWKKLLSGFVMSFIIFLAKKYLVNNWLGLVLQIFIGFFTYCAVLFALHDSFVYDASVSIIQRKRGK